MKGTIQLSGLRPDYNYALALNGRRGDPSNDVLLGIDCGSPELCGNWDGEGYWNFKTDLHTDSQGNASDTINVPLPPLDYHVKFFVKDPVPDVWCIALYNNHLIFSVEESD